MTIRFEEEWDHEEDELIDIEDGVQPDKALDELQPVAAAESRCGIASAIRSLETSAVPIAA